MLPLTSAAPAVSQHPALDTVLARPGVWRGRPANHETGTDTGFPALDQALHLHGWPNAGLVELLCSGPCPQALRLLLPTMAARAEGLVVLANPPARPRAETLRQAGIHSQRLLVMRSERQDILLRACHDALTSGAVSTLVVWLAPDMDDQTSLRRLHLAAREGRCLLVAMRPASQADRPSPAILRLRLRVLPPAHLGIDVIKQPGGWGGQQLSLALLPERLRQPLPASCDMPAPEHQHGAPAADTTLATVEQTTPHHPASWPRRAPLRAGLQNLPF